MSDGFWDAPGMACDEAVLKTDEGRQFARFLREAGEKTFTKILTLRRVEGNAGADAVVFKTQTGRPQHCAHPIRREETLAAVFPDDAGRPRVLALRKDFPQVPHLFLEEEEFPRSLCLYDQQHDSVRLTWTAASFLERIRYWLRHTATGTLHGTDQPLEPLIANSQVHFIFPPGILAEGTTKHLHVVSDAKAGEARTILSTWQGKDEDAAQGRKPGVQIAVFETSAQTHGVVRAAPKTLAGLDRLAQAAGLPLARQLAAKLHTWHVAGLMPQIGERELVLMVVLPKKRQAQGTEETTEYRAFLLGKSIKQIAGALGTLARKSTKAIEVSAIPDGALEKITVQVCQTHCSLSSKVAAELNGTAHSQELIAAIGAGALGSQTILNLLRAGWGTWAVIDPDIFLPHNNARHALDGFAVGHFKVSGLQHVADSIFPQEQTLAGFPDDVLRPKFSQTQAALRRAKVVVDFSASLPVSRHLAQHTDVARGISVFISPKGESLVMLAEDAARRARLHWLEMLHYRAVLCEPALAGTLTPREDRYRYGGGCRDLSAIVQQDDLALWSATSARGVRQLLSEDRAAVRIYLRHDDGRMELHTPSVTEPLSLTLLDPKLGTSWTIHLDAWLLQKLARFREKRLPNETGGVLLGVFDTFSKVCFIVDALPSPPDSTEWPTTYIRGCKGLPDQLRAIRRQTADQVTYVGEWHSHPDGCPARPSGADLQAYAWLLGHMVLEALPAVMLILGEREVFGMVNARADVP